MKLLLTIEVEDDLLDIPTLLFALPGALDSVKIATSAGVQETGPRGMQLPVPGSPMLAHVHFRLDYAETVERISAPVESAASRAVDQS